MAKVTVVGFSRPFNYTQKSSGEVLKKINVSVTISDAEYAEGLRSQELFLTVSEKFDYKWLKVGAACVIEYSKYGYPSYLEPV